LQALQNVAIHHAQDLIQHKAVMLWLIDQLNDAAAATDGMVQHVATAVLADVGCSNPEHCRQIIQKQQMLRVTIRNMTNERTKMSHHHEQRAADERIGHLMKDRAELEKSYFLSFNRQHRTDHTATEQLPVVVDATTLVDEDHVDNNIEGQYLLPLSPAESACGGSDDRHYTIMDFDSPDKYGQVPPPDFQAPFLREVTNSPAPELQKSFTPVKVQAPHVQVPIIVPMFGNVLQAGDIDDKMHYYGLPAVSAVVYTAVQVQGVVDAAKHDAIDFFRGRTVALSSTKKREANLLEG
jgi:hypothetical protein